jgi:hypothetical protein
MRAKSINVHALVDESEDPLETLETYFNTTVMNLTDAKTANNPVSPTVVISPWAHHAAPTSSTSIPSSSSSNLPSSSSSSSSFLPSSSFIPSVSILQPDHEITEDNLHDDGYEKV